MEKEYLKMMHVMFTLDNFMQEKDKNEFRHTNHPVIYIQECFIKMSPFDELKILLGKYWRNI
jgi:hypothetical protein